MRPFSFIIYTRKLKGPDSDLGQLPEDQKVALFAQRK